MIQLTTLLCGASLLSTLTVKLMAGIRSRSLAICIVYLDLEDMTSGQGHEKTFGHGQQFCEEVSSKLPANNYKGSRQRFWPCVVICGIL